MNSTITNEHNLLSQHALIISLAMTGLLFAIIYLLICLIHRQSHTVTYLLSCNVILSCSFYYIIVLLNHINAVTYENLSSRSCIIVSYLMLSAAASISYSLMLQSISRLFFIVFYRFKKLLSFKIHIYLLICIWLISFTLSPIPCALSKGFIYESSLSVCAINTTSISVIIYAMISGCLIPFSIIGFIYMYIMYYIRKQHHRRVIPTIQSTNRNVANRNLIVLRNIMINVTIMSVTGLPSFVIMILLVLRKANVIITIYCTLFTVFGVVSMTITSLFLTKNIRKSFLNLIHCRKIN